MEPPVAAQASLISVRISCAPVVCELIKYPDSKRIQQPSFINVQLVVVIGSPKNPLDPPFENQISLASLDSWLVPYLEVTM